MVADLPSNHVGSQDMPEPIIKVSNVTRTYHVGDVDVHAEHALRDAGSVAQHRGPAEDPTVRAVLVAQPKLLFVGGVGSFDGREGVAREPLEVLGVHER